MQQNFCLVNFLAKLNLICMGLKKSAASSQTVYPPWCKKMTAEFQYWFSSFFLFFFVSRQVFSFQQSYFTFPLSSHYKKSFSFDWVVFQYNRKSLSWNTLRARKRAEKDSGGGKGDSKLENGLRKPKDILSTKVTVKVSKRVCLCCFAEGASIAWILKDSCMAVTSM